MAKPYATVDEYIGAFPTDVRTILAQVRQTIRNAAPAAGETIKYGMPRITLDGRELISFAAWKHHIGLYSIPAVDATLARELAPYRAARGTLKFPLDKPIPYDLIARLVTLRVEQRQESGE